MQGKYTYIWSYAYYSVTITLIESLFFDADVTKFQWRFIKRLYRWRTLWRITYGPYIFLWQNGMMEHMINALKISLK